MVDLRGIPLFKAVHDDGSNYFIIKTRQKEDNGQILLKTKTAQEYHDWAVVLIESCLTDEEFTDK
jgi:hypothetical protein